MVLLARGRQGSGRVDTHHLHLTGTQGGVIMEVVLVDFRRRGIRPTMTSVGPGALQGRHILPGRLRPTRRHQRLEDQLLQSRGRQVEPLHGLQLITVGRHLVTTR